MKIKSKQQIIEHFISGNKQDQFIGVENEKFLLEKDTSVRANYCLLYTSPSPRD